MSAKLVYGLQGYMDIAGNGRDGPLFVAPCENLHITISIDPGNTAGIWGDRWEILMSSYGNFPAFALQTPLLELPETSFFEIPFNHSIGL